MPLADVPVNTNFRNGTVCVCGTVCMCHGSIYVALVLIQVNHGFNFTDKLSLIRGASVLTTFHVPT